jgi:uncharacterized SAM-binding protein YcdF (DUF218 family)
MNMFLDKLLPLAVYPLGLSILLVLGGLALSLIGRRYASVTILACALLILWIFSTPFVSGVLLSTLEESNSRQGAASADVAILLGGMVRGVNNVGEPDLNGSVDRAVKAARLYRNGSVKHILVTAPEAHLLASLLEEWGVPEEAIILENRSRNTFENATKSKRLWDAHQFRSGLLVTSASHMPRALAVFRRAGFDVKPEAADFRTHYPIGGIPDLLPDARSLEDSTIAIKEWIGLGVYKLRGGPNLSYDFRAASIVNQSRQTRVD